MSGFKSSDLSLDDAQALRVDADDPVALTVHSMPVAGEATQLPQSRKGRWQLWLMLLISVAPVAASYFMYYVARPHGALLNFGELIEPMRPMPVDLRVTTLDGKAEPLGDLKRQWLLVSVADGACDDTCRSNLYLQRQLRESLGKERDRMDWVWLIPDNGVPPTEIRAALADATVLHIDRPALQAWLAPRAGQRLEDHLYLVDPMGNWMMRFPAHLTVDMAEKAKRDLSRLLRASASWDQPGRD
ncbi:MAG: hypothetical protein BGO13_01815 [Burkholderiales bacterium 66-5]|uniref:hypothetical protein n=1 Tax=Comamonas badia TaxID=265291 RepID=UPI0004A4C4C5|nr:hypothetical protein [Comamonas badia]OJU91760.1 MAG: hypothetical protein BGO13_01815 [Burkholderiales bacterium 66-5]